MCMTCPADMMNLEQLTELRERWTAELHVKKVAFDLLSTEISILDLVDRSTTDAEWERAAQMLREQGLSGVSLAGYNKRRQPAELCVV